MIKVLWTVNTLSPQISKHFNISSSHSISWVDAMAERIKNDGRLNLSIAAPGRVDSIKSIRIDDIDYYIVPENNGLANWKKLISDIKPRIIHAYGTEQEQTLYVSLNAGKIPVLVSLQGLLSEYQHHYYAGIEFGTMLKYTPIRDIIRPSGFFSGKKNFIKRSKVEKEILSRVKYVEGRSTWDRVSSLNINPNLKYYYCPRMLRRPFYECEKWDIQDIERHTIFVSQGNYPIKGIHFVFKAVGKLIKKYPRIRIVISGSDMFARMKGVKRFLTTGYQRYLYDLAEQTGIRNNISFVGYQSAEGIVSILKKTHIAIIPSAIENAPNSLAEAMIVGTPCIASFVGGNMDMLCHNQEGFLYCFNEPNMLAEYIERIFENDDIALAFSEKAREAAFLRHSPESLLDSLIGIYEQVLMEEEKSLSCS